MLLLVSLLAAHCAASHDGDDGDAIVGLALEDIAHVPVSAETMHEDLPGVEEFELLSDEGRASVMARANRSACSCGCPGHTVAHCLHQGEACDVAVTLARRMVSDRLAVELELAGRQEAAIPDTPEEPVSAPAAAPADPVPNPPQEQGNP